MAKMVGYRRTTDSLYTAVKRTPTGQNCATCKLSRPFMGLYKCTQHQFIPVTTDNNICDFFEA